MFKADALDGIGEFDIDAEVVGIEFEFVTLGERLVFLDIHGEGRDGTGSLDFPVLIALGRRLKINHPCLIMVPVRTFVRILSCSDWQSQTRFVLILVLSNGA